MLALSNKIAGLIRAAAGNEQTIDPKYDKPKQAKVILEPDQILKQEILDTIGIVDPKIRKNIEDSISRINFKRKTKTEVIDEIVKAIDKHADQLRMARVNINKVFLFITLLKRKEKEKNETEQLKTSSVYFAKDTKPEEKEYWRSLKYFNFLGMTVI